jgi:predicted MFS family arabinose efflux permease
VTSAASTGSLWRHADFRRLWLGQTVSEFGSVLTRDALPLTALLVLSATPAQMGVLGAAASLPALVLGLPAGAFVDRLRRRPILIACDLASAALLSTVPLAWLLGVLRIEQLYAVAALAGALSLVFDVAYTAYLPSLVERERLAEGNSKLGASESLAEIGGSALAGALVQALSGPITILIDALSFLASSASVSTIRKPEPPPSAPREGRDLRREILEGLRLQWRDPTLAALAASAVTSTFFGSFFAALYALYAIRELGIGPATLGLLIASGGIGSLVGALLARRLARALGLGSMLIGGLALSGGLNLLIPLAAGRPLPLALALLWIAQLAGDLVATAVSIQALSLRQAITPDRFLGRVNAGMEFLQGGVATAGVLGGGLLAQWIGLREAIWIASFGTMLAFLWPLCSPIRRLRTLPTG